MATSGIRNYRGKNLVRIDRQYSDLLWIIWKNYKILMWGQIVTVEIRTEPLKNIIQSITSSPHHSVASWFGWFFFTVTFVSFVIPSLQLWLTTSLFYNLDSTLKTNSQYLSIVQCRVLVMDCTPCLWVRLACYWVTFFCFVFFLLTPLCLLLFLVYNWD
jgi:hypothetical protein